MEICGGSNVEVSLPHDMCVYVMRTGGVVYRRSRSFYL